MAWFDRWRRPPETGEEQLARVRAATPPADPAGPPANLPTQLDRLRAILEHLEHYFYYYRGPLHADVAAAVSTPERPLTARRVALLHEADPADLGTLDAAELGQIAGIALRHPDHLARDPAVVARAAANLDLLQADAVCRQYLGALPAVRPDPDLTSHRGRHAYAAALRHAVRRTHPEAVSTNPRLHWGRRGDGRPGLPPPPQPVARARMVAEVATMLPLLWLAERGELPTLAADRALPPLDDRFAAWAAARNHEAGFAYRFRGAISHPDMPIHLGDGELAEAVRQARETTAACAGGRPN